MQVSFPPGRRVGGSEAAAAARPRPRCARALRRRSREPSPSRRVAALRLLIPPPPTLPRACEGRCDRAPAGKGGGGHPGRVCVCVCAPAAWRSPQLRAPRAAPVLFPPAGATRPFARRPGWVLPLSPHSRPFAGPGARPAAPPFRAHTPPRPAFRGLFGFAGRGEPSQEPGLWLPVAVSDNWKSLPLP